MSTCREKNPYIVEQLSGAMTLSVHSQWVYPHTRTEDLFSTDTTSKKDHDLSGSFQIVGFDSAGEDQCINFMHILVHKDTTVRAFVTYLWFFAKRSGTFKQGEEVTTLGNETNGDLTYGGWKVEIHKGARNAPKLTFDLFDVINNKGGKFTQSLSQFGCFRNFHVTMYSPAWTEHEKIRQHSSRQLAVMNQLGFDDSEEYSNFIVYITNVLGCANVNEFLLYLPQIQVNMDGVRNWFKSQQ